MFTLSEFDRIKSEYLEKQNDRRKKLKMIWGILLGFTVLLILFFLIVFPNQFKDAETAWILPTYGGIATATTLIGFLITIQYTSEKPFFEYVYPEVYNKLNMDEGLFFEYHPYEKTSREFNTNGGLFTRLASVKSRRHVIGRTEDQIPFDIYDCTMTTSNGKNQQTHFDGTYIIIKKQLHSIFQARSNGSPKLKGVKFDRVEEAEDMKVYKERDKDLSNLDLVYLRYINRLKENPQYKRVYFSIVDGEIHLALWYKKHPARKQKIFTIETLNKVYNVFYDEYKLINEINEMDSY
jgi:hypothetical protein